MLIFVKLALSSSDYGANILTISDFWDPPSRPSYMYVIGIHQNLHTRFDCCCCYSLAVTSKDTPIHLYDAFTGELRCSYRAFNHVVSLLFKLYSRLMTGTFSLRFLTKSDTA